MRPPDWGSWRMNGGELTGLVSSVLGILSATLLLWARITRSGDGRRRELESELRSTRERLDQQTSRLLELEQHNSRLQQQLEWDARLLEAQDRAMQQFGGGAAARAALPSVTQTPSAAR